MRHHDIVWHLERTFAPARSFLLDLRQLNPEVHTRVRRSTLAPDQGMSAISSERNAPVVTVITLNTEGGMNPRDTHPESRPRKKEKG
jgi:hypothetical protein